MNTEKLEIKSAMFNLTQAAQYLNVTERWMRRAKINGIPYYKIGKWVHFTKDDLDLYIAKQRISGDENVL